MTDSRFIEVEELGRVAMFAVLLVPGFAWIAKGQSTAAMVRRSIVVGTVLVAAAVVEGLMDRSAAEVADTVAGA